MKKKKQSLLSTTDPGICIGSRLKILNRNVENIYRKHLGPFNITSSQLSILFYIAKSNDVRQKDVGAFLHLERSTVSRDLTRLVKKGLVNRKGIEARPTLVLTKTGSALIEKIIPSWEMAHEESSELLGEDVTIDINELVSKFRG